MNENGKSHDAKDRLEALAVASVRYKKDSDKARRSSQKQKATYLYGIAETLAIMFSELKDVQDGKTTGIMGIGTSVAETLLTYPEIIDLTGNTTKVEHGNS